MVQMTFRRGGGDQPGSVSRYHEEIISVHGGMAYDSMSKPHSQTTGKAVNRSTQLSKHSRIKVKEAKLNRLSQFWVKTLNIAHIFRMSSSLYGILIKMVSLEKDGRLVLSYH
jgi:hypothetical protein